MIFYILIALQALDVLSTVVALRNPKLHEANWLLKPIMDKLGVLPALLLVKGVFIALLALYWREIQVELLYALAALYVYVVFSNIRLIRNS